MNCCTLLDEILHEHVPSKLSVNMAYFCTNFVIIMQFSFVRQGWCFPTYFPKFFLKSYVRSFENADRFPGKEICLRSFEIVAPVVVISVQLQVLSLCTTLLWW